MSKHLFSTSAAVLFLTLTVAAQTYSASIPTPINIQDGLSATACLAGAPATATLNVPVAYGPAGNITITVGISHTWVGDVEILVTSPTGSKLVLMSPACNGNADDSSNLLGNYIFGDGGTQTVMAAALAAACGDTCNIATGTYRPDAAILPYLQCGVGGTWSIAVRDHLSFDTGSLSAFSITLSPGAPTNGSRESFVICQPSIGGAVILGHANAPATGTYFNPMVFNNPASISNGWLFGLNIPFGELISEINSPFPGLFLGTFTSGGASYFPVPGVPPGIQVSIVGIHFNAGGIPVFASWPVTYTTI